jgi:hypothetical protein
MAIMAGRIRRRAGRPTTATSYVVELKTGGVQTQHQGISIQDDSAASLLPNREATVSFSRLRQVNNWNTQTGFLLPYKLLWGKKNFMGKGWIT